MFAGTTVGRQSGNLIGVHQRIDKIARKHLRPLLADGQYFPKTSEILHFEGDNGPDGVKRKSPSVDEPWHFIDPEKEVDAPLFGLIHDHLKNLSDALREDNHQRAAFEAAWAAHAIVDGLTPAHHYPLAEKIEELFGMPHHERITFRQKNIIKGGSRIDTLLKNWEYWGSGGIFSAHFLFEWGVAATMVGRVYPSIITSNDVVELKLRGYDAVFRESLQRVVALDVFTQFQQYGWNWRVARIVHKQLMPEINRAVTLGWLWAALQSKQGRAQ